MLHGAIDACEGVKENGKADSLKEEVVCASWRPDLNNHADERGVEEDDSVVLTEHLYTFGRQEWVGCH